MSDEQRVWARVGGIAGVGTVLAYLTVLFAPLPWALRRLIFFTIGPAAIIFVLGLDRLLKTHRRPVVLELATLFGVIGLAIGNLMAVVQGAIDARMDARLPLAADPASRSMIAWIRNSVNAVHLGMDVSFDIFFLVSVILFGISMLHHPRFGAKFGIPGCLAAIATLGLNLHSFPLPPEPDLGPIVALWLSSVAVRMLLCANAKAGADERAAQENP